MFNGQTWLESMASMQADGPTLTAAAAASALSTQAKGNNFPAGFWGNAGKAVLILASGRITVAVTTPGTVRWDVRLGGTVVWDSTAIACDTAGYTNVGWFLALLLTQRAVGTAANLMGQAVLSTPILAGNPATPPKGSLTALLPWNTAPAVGGNFDATVSQALDFFYTPSLGTTSQICHQFVPITLN